MDAKELAESVKRIRSAPNDMPDMMETINALVQLVGEMHDYVNTAVNSWNSRPDWKSMPPVEICMLDLNNLTKKSAPIAELAKGE